MPALKAPGDKPERPLPNLPEAICFRVTRNCNARCRFCLAPPDGEHPDLDVLQERLKWLSRHGVRRVHFCGGEPTLHPALSRLLDCATACGLKTSLGTNAILLPESLLHALRANRAAVRVSLHGDRAHHDAIAGAGCHDRATGNLRRLVKGNIATSLQTTVIAGGDWVVEWAVQFCLQEGIRRLSIIPFLPRGEGSRHRDEFAFTLKERNAVRRMVSVQRRAVTGRLDLRWLDFSSSLVPVVEPDGRIVLEGANEALDRVIGSID